jgi:hypothetical protein
MIGKCCTNADDDARGGEMMQFYKEKRERKKEKEEEEKKEREKRERRINKIKKRKLNPIGNSLVKQQFNPY